MHLKQKMPLVFAVASPSPSRPFWLLPNLLSLDAPIVAIVWQRLFAYCLQVTVPLPISLVLGFTVWLIYSADRVLDARRGQCSTARHHFHYLHAAALTRIWPAVLICTAMLALSTLPLRVFVCGAILLALVAIYFVLIHFGLTHGKLAWNLRKEPAVAIIFAAGVTLAPFALALHLRMAVVCAAALFMALCWINCQGIETWNKPGTNLSLQCAAVTAAALALAFFEPALATAIFLSAVALSVLDRVRTKFSAEAVRVLADAALLSPLVFAAITQRM